MPGIDRRIMNVSFLQDDPLNTVIVDSSNGQPLYEVDTPLKAGTRTTTVRRSKPGVASGEGQIIAAIRWRALGSSTITLYGTTMRIKDWLTKTGVFSSYVALPYTICFSVPLMRLVAQI
jgi:Family of unknown function (DUF6593)